GSPSPDVAEGSDCSELVAGNTDFTTCAGAIVTLASSVTGPKFRSFGSTPGKLLPMVLATLFNTEPDSANASIKTLKVTVTVPETGTEGTSTWTEVSLPPLPMVTVPAVVVTEPGTKFKSGSLNESLITTSKAGLVPVLVITTV